MPVLPGAEPFTLGATDGSVGSVGIVLCHGFTSTPQSLRAWGEHLAAAGYPVHVPRLPGHGTRWQDLNLTRWPDWYGELERALDRMRTRCPVVFAMGLSLGATLALRLAEQRGADVAGLVLVNPSLGTERRDAALLRVVSKLVPSVRGIASDIKKPGVVELAYDRMPLRAAASMAQLWQVTCADLSRVTQPMLVFRSRVDHVVEPLSGRLLREGARAAHIEERILEDSYHVATLDNDAPAIFAGSVDFVRAHAPAVSEKQ